MTDGVLQIFAKSPIPGKVKTRLIPKLGKRGACELYEQLLAKTIQNTNHNNIRCEIWLKGERNDKLNQILNIRKNLYLYEQKGNNLGERMYNALKSGLKKYSKVVLIGCDCPQLSKIHYVKMYKSLNTHDLALIPALDGGYVAIGVRKIDKSLFENITWGSNTVYTDTLKRAQALNYTCASLKPLRDLDTPEDLKWHRKQKKHPVMIVPATFDALNGRNQNVFGGWLMSQMDIAASIPAVKKAKGPVVTRAVKNLEFINPAFLGDLINLYAEIKNIGSTSITIEIEAIAERNPKKPEAIKIASAEMIFVAINKLGRPRKIAK